LVNGGTELKWFLKGTVHKLKTKAHSEALSSGMCCLPLGPAAGCGNCNLGCRTLWWK